jgi:tRNA dimethylallyltransferase
MRKLFVIGGPTASGKTKAAIALAKHLKCPILSADSRQFFREMNIGTAKPSEEELAQAEHYFIDDRLIDEDFSAGAFEREALILLDELFLKHEYVILVGGSGLYIDAVCKGMDELPKSDELRETLNAIFQREGLNALQEELKERDPMYFENCDNQNPIRVIRALEIIRLTGKTMDAVFAQQGSKRNFSTQMFVLDLPRNELYERINLRVDFMMEQGLIKEAEQLIPFKYKNALQTVGYKELFDYFDGKIDLERAVALIKQNSRRYAKRQITWFKRYENAIWVHPKDFENLELLLERIA